MLQTFPLVPRLFRWWLTELSACLPALLRRVLFYRRPILAIGYSMDTATLRYDTGNGIRDLAEIPIHSEDPTRNTAVVRHALRGIRRKAIDVVAVLPADRALRRIVDLPLAAAENLREVLGFEMDRNTPFRAEDVAYDYRVLAADKEAKRLTVELIAAPKALVDEVVRRASMLGLSPDRVDLVDDENQLCSVNLLTSVDSGRGRPFSYRLDMAFAFIACALLVAAAILPLKRKQEVLAAYEVQIEESRVAAVDAAALQDRVAQLLKRKSFLTQRRQTKLMVVAVLNEATEKLADDTWLVQLRLNGDELALSGYAPSAAALIPVLESSALFADVHLNAPVTSDPTIRRERFSLLANIVSGAAD